MFYITRRDNTQKSKPKHFTKTKNKKTKTKFRLIRDTQKNSDYLEKKIFCTNCLNTFKIQATWLRASVTENLRRTSGNVSAHFYDCHSPTCHQHSHPSEMLHSDSDRTPRFVFNSFIASGRSYYKSRSGQSIHTEDIFTQTTTTTIPLSP